MDAQDQRLASIEAHQDTHDHHLAAYDADGQILISVSPCMIPIWDAQNRCFDSYENDGTNRNNILPLYSQVGTLGYSHRDRSIHHCQITTRVQYHIHIIFSGKSSLPFFLYFVCIANNA